MENKIKISVIMPTYGVEKYFKQCIESVINQTFKDIEIIPVDNGSPDNCGKMMDEYAKTDSRIKPIHQANAGYGGATNAGIRKAVGEYIAIVETDDFIDETMMEKLYNQAIKTGADLTKCSFYNYSSKKIKPNLQTIIPKEVFSIDEYPIFLINQPAIWSGLYKRDWLLENDILFLQTPGASFQDILFHLKTAYYARKISLLPDPLYYYRVDNPNSSVNSKKKNSMAIFSSLEAMSGIFKTDIKRYAKIKSTWFLCVIRDIDWNFYRLYKGLRKDFFYASRIFINNYVNDIEISDSMTRRQANILNSLLSNDSYNVFILKSLFRQFFYFNITGKNGGRIIRFFGISIFEERVSYKKIRYSFLFIPFYKVVVNPNGKDIYFLGVRIGN